MSLVEVKRRIEASILQMPKSDYLSKLNSAKQNIISLFKIRQDAEYISSWISFFDSIPVNTDSVHESYENTLRNLAIKYGGNIKLKGIRFFTYKTYG